MMGAFISTQFEFHPFCLPLRYRRNVCISNPFLSIDAKMTYLHLQLVLFSLDSQRRWNCRCSAWVISRKDLQPSQVNLIFLTWRYYCQSYSFRGLDRAESHARRAIPLFLAGFLPRFFAFCFIKHIYIMKLYRAKPLTPHASVLPRLFVIDIEATAGWLFDV